MRRLVLLVVLLVSIKSLKKRQMLPALFKKKVTLWWIFKVSMLFEGHCLREVRHRSHSTIWIPIDDSAGLLLSQIVSKNGKRAWWDLYCIRMFGKTAYNQMSEVKDMENHKWFPKSVSCSWVNSSCLAHLSVYLMRDLGFVYGPRDWVAYAECQNVTLVLEDGRFTEVGVSDYRGDFADSHLHALRIELARTEVYHG